MNYLTVNAARMRTTRRMLGMTRESLSRLWDAAVQNAPEVRPPISGTQWQDIRNIIRGSRETGRSISRADAEGIYLAKLYDFTLLTGDDHQTEIAHTCRVTVIHRQKCRGSNAAA